MLDLSRRGLAAIVAAFAIAMLGMAALPAHAQQKPVIKVSSLTLPVFNPLVWNIMKARGIDAKHGFELDARAYPSISAFYAAFATGETDVLIGGPTILQKLYQEGVPVRIIATGFTLADLVIFAKDEKIKSLADLKGKQLAIDMGGSQFQVTKIYASAKGGYAKEQLDHASGTMEPLFEAIIKHIPPPRAHAGEGFNSSLNVTMRGLSALTHSTNQSTGIMLLCVNTMKGKIRTFRWVILLHCGWLLEVTFLTKLFG